MESSDQNTACAKCGHPQMTSPYDLTDDEKMLVRLLPASARFPETERKKHRFCKRCWFEDFGPPFFSEA